MTGILLAGGKSSRMGIDKAFLEYSHRLLYEYPLSVLQAFCKEIFISSSDTRFEITGLPVIPDKYPGQGPLAGIYTCLSLSNFSKALVLSCDMPFMDPEFIHGMIRHSPGFQVTVGTDSNGMPEPLAGIYEKNILPIIFANLEKGKNKVSEIYPALKVKLINTAEEGFDPEVIYLNINRQEDFKIFQSLHKNIGKNK